MLIAIFLSNEYLFATKKAKSLEKAITTRNLGVLCATSKVEPKKALSNAQKNTIFQTIDERLQVLEDKWRILVFSEHFFSQNPFDNIYVNDVIERCKELTIRHPKLLISPNLVHAFNIEDQLDFLRSTSNKVNRNANTEYIDIPTQRDKDVSILLHDNVDSPNRIANYSLTIHNNQLLSIYRKGMYYKEAYDQIFEQGYAYEFGDWEDHKLVDSEITKVLFDKQLLATRICADASDLGFPPFPKLRDDGILIVPADHKNADCTQDLLGPNQLAILIDNHTVGRILTQAEKIDIASELHSDFTLFSCEDLSEKAPPPEGFWHRLFRKSKKS